MPTANFTLGSNLFLTFHVVEKVDCVWIWCWVSH